MKITKPIDTQSKSTFNQRRATETAAHWPGHELMDDPVLARVLYGVWSGDPVTIVPSPPGAGKTRLVALLAPALAARAGLRVAVAAQTRNQATQLAHRIGAVHGNLVASLVWKKGAAAPHCPGVDVVNGSAVRWPKHSGAVMIATTARWLYCDPKQLGADVMIIDEAWQVTYADACALGAFARQIVCVGDPGQIDPVVTAPTGKWAADTRGPQLPAPDAIIAAHRDGVGVVKLQHTWRLGAQTTALIQPWCYPDLPFTSRRPAEHIAVQGNQLPEVAHREVTSTGGTCDQALLDAVVEHVLTLLDGTLHTSDTERPMTAADLAVVTAHVNQAAAIQARLADHPGVLIGTANALQGLERAASVVLHPLAGYRTIEPFALDSGRLCVMLSRHRAHTTVICDQQTTNTLDAADPTHELMVGLHTELLESSNA